MKDKFEFAAQLVKANNAYIELHMEAWRLGYKNYVDVHSLILGTPLLKNTNELKIALRLMQ